MSALNTADLYLVVMAGGSGTRFWPKSTSARPKQLLHFGKKGSTESPSLIKQTLARFEGWVGSGNQMIVTTEKLKAAMVQEVGPKVQILAEPMGRNTAPCVYWAAKTIAAQNRRAVMMVMPADHFMSHPSEFLETVKNAAEWAQNHDDLVTLGVRPTRPETGYGYLQVGKEMSRSPEVSRVDAFVEKPNLVKAEEFMRAGNYLWNGGMFLWRVDAILKAFETHMPEMARIVAKNGGDVLKAYPELPSQSIDYGVMEKAKNVVTLPLDCGWDDVGNWTSLEGLANFLEARVGANVVTGGELVSVDSHGSIVDVPHKLVALLGVQDLIIVETDQVLMVADKSRAQEIREIVEQVKAKRPDLV